MKGALDGIRVLDFSTLLPGPMASLFLREAGAEVIKVENPARGDEMRSYSPKWGEDSGNFHLLNAGKKSLAVDLKSPEGRARLAPLIAEADILIEQFRPGVMARLGLSYDEVRAQKPDIIYCSITGYGQTGPRAQRAGHDLNYQGDAGLLALSHGPEGAPVLPPALIADIAGGTYPALVNILLALRQRDRTGDGAWLDIAMAENLFPFTYWAQADGRFGGNWPGNGDALVTGGSPRYALYPMADGRILAAAPIEDKFWVRFCEAIGLDPALREDAADPAATRAAVARRIAAEPSAHWSTIFGEADCCCTVLQTLEEAMRDPHFTARGLFAGEIENGAGTRSPALPIPVCAPLRAEPGPRHAPRLGEGSSEG
ncbi:CaiB/BaiF CoA transferase family protein [Celeribacter indicus]|uniref:L-carnitine dehydratase/bile acid-inducible protein F n=1 Tax=Celeribacter indicus TaxID=1208324 RepID=A0A0B5E848_9RHOB|nr:CaiB/BaiF CoA-transferase family protein [Celeribacter indicus]AJE49191.1 hypothetical protein P73_4476 [Celeribacter indicus]SDX18477.1 Crotonobetainyl-CoA:carnitine CoA-transferase CaiB [Celeribacter indicus]